MDSSNEATMIDISTGKLGPVIADLHRIDVETSYWC